MHFVPSVDQDPIALFYDAALGEASWDDALVALSDRAGGAAIMLGVTVPRMPVLSDFWTRHFATHLHREAGFSDGDIADPNVNPDLRGSMVMPVGRARDARAYVSEEETLRTPLFRATMLTQKLTARHLLVAARDDDLWAGGFAAHVGGRDLDAAEVRELDVALPHIGRALRLRGEIERCRGVEASLLSALESLDAGVVVVDGGLRILTSNTAAEKMFEAGDGLRSDRGRLGMSGPARRRVLDHVAACASPGRSGPVPLPVAAPRPSGHAPYSVQVYPAVGAARLPGSARACATIVIQDPARGQSLPESEALVAALGLTPAEARVARLVPLAESKRVLAGRLGLTENTVKSHLATIRMKLGARNMTELAQVVGRVPTGPPGRNGKSLTKVDER
jgi:DNA-binding CsgD family transcriptional regulator/PAS domain-containing protein